MAMRHAGVPGSYPGTPWLCFVGFSDRAARLYAEPVLALVLAIWAAGQGMVLLRFRPMFFLREVLPLPYGIETPFPLWYRQYGVLIAHVLPVVSALTLALYNRLTVPEPDVTDAPPTEEPLAFNEAGQADAPALPVPSAARMARELQYQQKGNIP